MLFAINLYTFSWLDLLFSALNITNFTVPNSWKKCTISDKNFAVEYFA